MIRSWYGMGGSLKRGRVLTLIGGLLLPTMPGSAFSQAYTVPAAPPSSTTPSPAAVGIIPEAYFYSRFERREGYDTTIAASGDFVRYRGMFSLTTTPLAINSAYTVQVKISPQVGGFWGIGGNSAEDPGLLMHEALIRLQMPGFRLDAGRLELAYGDEIILGPGRWGYPGRSFDGLRLHAQANATAPWLDLLAMQVDEGMSLEGGTTSNLGAGDILLAGAYAGVGRLLPIEAELDAYALAVLEPGVLDSSDALTGGGMRLTLGSRFKGMAGMFDWRAEAGIQVGSKQSADTTVAAQGFQLDAEAGVTLPLAKGLRLYGEGFFASGDDPQTSSKDEAWFKMYPTAHRWLGLMDVIPDRNNVAGGVLGVRFDPFSILRFYAETHFFIRPYLTLADGTALTNAFMGTELDTGVSYKVGKVVTLRGAYDLFFPAADAGWTNESPWSFVELELMTRF